MLSLLDQLLRDLFLTEIPSLPNDAHVRFQPPDEDLRTDVMSLPSPALNVYLVDLRENRRLRSNERTRTHDSLTGITTETPAPARLDCHYLITAWSPAVLGAGVEPTVDEHALLYQAASVLMQAAPLNPADVYAAGSLPLAGWEPYDDTELPTEVLPVSGFDSLGEFWTSMGDDARWRPAIYLIVTLPITLAGRMSGPIVTTRITEYRLSGVPESAERWIQIGGYVLDETDPLPDGTPSPIEGAWVRIENATGQLVSSTETDDAGRFTFDRLRAGSYVLSTGVIDLGIQTRTVDVPSETGEYDLRFP